MLPVKVACVWVKAYKRDFLFLDKLLHCYQFSERYIALLVIGIVAREGNFYIDFGIQRREGFELRRTNDEWQRA